MGITFPRCPASVLGLLIFRVALWPCGAGLGVLLPRCPTGVLGRPYICNHENGASLGFPSPRCPAGVLGLLIFRVALWPCGAGLGVLLPRCPTSVLGRPYLPIIEMEPTWDSHPLFVFPWGLITRYLPEGAYSLSVCPRVHIPSLFLLDENYHSYICPRVHHTLSVSSVPAAH